MQCDVKTSMSVTRADEEDEEDEPDESDESDESDEPDEPDEEEDAVAFIPPNASFEL